MLMPRSRLTCEALSIGQLAKRWGVSANRIRGLVEAGQLPGAFKVPSVGRYGAAVKIPLATVVQAEQDWAVVLEDEAALRRKRHSRRGGSPPALKHFPELMSNPEPAGECHGDAQR
jgi:hypothetical protein